MREDVLAGAGGGFASMSPTRVRKPRVLPTSHQSRIDHSQAHSQQWSLWKPGSQEGACGAGAWEEGLARVSHVSSPKLSWCPVEKSQHLLVVFGPSIPHTCPFCQNLSPKLSSSSDLPLKPSPLSPLPARRSESVSGVPGSRAGQASPPRGLWLELLQRKSPPPPCPLAHLQPAVLLASLSCTCLPGQACSQWGLWLVCPWDPTGETLALA